MSSPWKGALMGSAGTFPIFRGTPFLAALRGAAAGLAPYLGPVATGTYFPTAVYTFGATGIGLNSYTAHWAAQDITSVQLRYDNTVANTVVGGVVTEHTTSCVALNLTVVIEYPVGVYTRIKKSGANTMALAIGGTLVTDVAAVVIPKNAKFIVHTYYEKQGGGQVFVPGTYDIGNGVSSNEPASNDKTGTFSILGAATNWSVADFRLGPQAILATTTNRTFALPGDSIQEGVQDGVTDANKACTGVISRAIHAAGYGHINIGVGNDRIEKFLLSSSKRMEVLGYCSDVAPYFGANDAFFRTGAQIRDDLLSLISMAPSKRWYMSTVNPVGVSSTDNFATVANQTINGGVTAVLTTLNGFLRGVLAGTVRTWDINAVLSSTPDSGKWTVSYGLVNGNTAAGDATHPNALGATTVASSGQINPAA